MVDGPTSVLGEFELGTYGIGKVVGQLFKETFDDNGMAKVSETLGHAFIVCSGSLGEVSACFELGVSVKSYVPP